MRKPSGDTIFGTLIATILIAFFVGMVVWAIREDKAIREAADNQVRCETIDADYIEELDKCVKDDKILEVPGR